MNDLSPQVVYTIIGILGGSILAIGLVIVLIINWGKINWDAVLDGTIRFCFFTAYVVFLLASIRHIAYFFQSFEEPGTSWLGSYGIAAAFDGTSLILLIRISVGRQKSDAAFWSIIGLIVLITAFSWVVNWEYDTQFQSQGLSRVPLFLHEVNPWLASAFAALNIGYSIVGRYFTGQNGATLQERLAKRKARIQAQHTFREEVRQITGEQPETVTDMAGKAGGAIGTFIGSLVSRVSVKGSPQPAPMSAQLSTPLPKWPEPQGNTHEEAKEHFRDLQVWAQQQQEGQPTTLKSETDDLSLTSPIAVVRDRSSESEEDPITDPGLNTQPRIHVMPQPFDRTKTFNMVDGKHCIRLADAVKIWDTSEGALKRFLQEHPQYRHSGWVGKTEFKLIETDAEILVKESARSKRTARAAV